MAGTLNLKAVQGLGTGTVTVSYTQLDVYKRQQKELSAVRVIASFIGRWKTVKGDLSLIHISLEQARPVQQEVDDQHQQIARHGGIKKGFQGMFFQP